MQVDLQHFLWNMEMKSIVPHTSFNNPGLLFINRRCIVPHARRCIVPHTSFNNKVSKVSIIVGLDNKLFSSERGFVTSTSGKMTIHNINVNNTHIHRNRKEMYVIELK